MNLRLIPFTLSLLTSTTEMQHIQQNMAYEPIHEEHNRKKSTLP